MKIQIKYNRFLDPVFLSYFQERFKLTLIEEQSIEEINSVVKEYKKEWQKKETIILDALENITGLTFKRNYLDVHIVQKIS